VAHLIEIHEVVWEMKHADMQSCQNMQIRSLAKTPHFAFAACIRNERIKKHPQSEKHKTP
jgi:hypothetical protein